MRRAFVLVALLCVREASAQDITSAAAAVTRFRDVVDGNAQVAAGSANFVIKFEQSILASSGCLLVASRHEESTLYVSATEATLHLDSLSPDLRPTPFADSTTFSLEVLTSSGASSIPVTQRVSTGRAGESSKTQRRTRSQFGFVFGDRASADSAVRYLGAAIRACGGRPRSAEAIAVAEREQHAVSENAQRFMALDLPSAERQRLIGQCEARIREQLKAPMSARFDTAPVMTRSQDGLELTVIGDVEAQNELGGFRARTYVCSFERFGKRYVPKTAGIVPVAR